MKVLKTNRRFLALFTRRKIREILKALIIVVAPPMEILEMQVKKRDRMEPMTIVKSKMFQLSLKYCFPNPVSFTNASSKNMAVNTQFRLLVIVLIQLSILYQMMQRTIVFKKIQTKITLSNQTFCYILKKNNLNLDAWLIVENAWNH